ncbi:hypothetical protein ABPG75_003900 [Micractinium tetrahymenae]
MGRITVDLLRRRAEHNDRCLATLQEIGLHAQGIERLELLNQHCRALRILLLQNNLIAKIEGLHRLKELEHLNLALNNITRVQNLQRCEGLRRLDLTANFVDLPGLLSLRSLVDLEHLEELHLLGNPCARWPGYRPYVLATLPRLRSLDGEPVRPSERIAAAQQLPDLEARLRAELAAQGIDSDVAAQVEDDSLLDAEVEETGYVDERGQLVRPWCPATRILEQREAEAEAAAAEAKRRAAQETGAGLLGAGEREPPPRTAFPELVEGQPVYQKNEGGWEYTLGEAAEGRSLQLDVAFGRYLDTSAIQADVQPRCVRLLAKGRLLQLALPEEVAPDATVAQRSKVTGNLLITMPLAEGALTRVRRPACAGNAAAVGTSATGRGDSSGSSRAVSRAAQLALPAELPPAVVSAAEDDEPPPL